MQWAIPSIQSEALTRHQLDDHAQRNQDCDKVNRYGAAGMRREIRGKESSISRAQPDKEEQPLTECQPQNATRGHQNKAFRLA